MTKFRLWGKLVFSDRNKKKIYILFQQIIKIKRIFSLI